MTIPGLVAARSYRREWAPRDVVAGMVLASLLVPQGMAYAELAGLPAITGLYTSILCLLAYAIFGPSRILVLGPDSALGPMIAASILPLMVGSSDPSQAVTYASVLALLVGAFMVVGALARLGFIADLLSKPTQIGYMNGLALTILVGQLPKLFGFSTEADGFIGEASAFVHGLTAGAVVPAAAAIGLAGVLVILVLQRWLPKLPAVLIAVVGSMVAAALLGLADLGVKLVGTLPQGLPPLTVPLVPLSDLPLLVAGAAGIAVVSLADTISTSAAFAERTGQDVRPNREMIGIGSANIAAGFFQGFPVSTSASRTAVAERAGARTQLTGVVGALVIAGMLLLVPGLMQWLPQPTLAAVVIVASVSLADLPATRRLWRQRHTEFGIATAAFAGVVLLGVLPGIAVAIVLNILNVFRRAWDPYRTTLGDVPGLPGYHAVSVYPHAELIPGLVIYRFDAPLIFANARTFRDEVRELARSDPPPRMILVAAEPITDVDTTAGEMIEDLHADLEAAGVQLAFAELKDAVRLKIRGYGLVWLEEQEDFYPTVGAAVRAYRAAHGIPKGEHHRDDHGPERPPALEVSTPG